MILNFHMRVEWILGFELGWVGLVLGLGWVVYLVRVGSEGSGHGGYFESYGEETRYWRYQWY